MRLAAAAFVCGAIAAPAPLLAQAAAPPTREELGLGSDPRQQGERPSRLLVDGGIERGPCPLADPSLAQTTVTFSSVTFGNLSAVAPAVLDSSWKHLAGREVPVAALCEVRDRAATVLREMGYLAAVQIPPQRIDKGGDVRMDVLVARLVEVQVRGDAGRSESLIAKHLVNLTNQQWFNLKAAERHLLLLGDLPGYDVRLTLRPAKGAPGDVVGDVLVTRQPIELSVGAQNLGSKATGREGLFAQAVFNGLTGHGDRTIISVFNTVDLEEQTVIRAAHGMAIGSDGLRLEGSLLYGRGEPGLGSNFKTETLIGQLELSYPLVRTQSLTLSAAGGLDLVDQNVDLGAVPVSRDSLRVAYARLGIDMTDKTSITGRGGYSAAEPRFRFAATIEARQGLDALGASDDCIPVIKCIAPRIPISNLLADPSAFVLRGQAVIEYRPIPDITVAIAPRLQYSGDALLGYEQFSLGNYTIGRGLDPGIVLGNSGAGSSFELRYGSMIPDGQESIAVQPFAFLDAAWAWSNDDGLSADPRKVLTAGGGVRARWGDQIDANLVLAAPLRRAGFQARKGDVRLLFTIRARLVPWKP